MKVAVACILVALSALTHAVIHLGPHNVDSSSVTVSGISSGAAMATQLHVALSATVHGSAIFAGVPYYCALGLAAEALTCMSSPALISVPTLIAETNALDALFSIDSTANLANDKAYIFSGTIDSVVMQGTNIKLQEFYEHYGVTVTTEYSLTAEHCLPTDYYGPSCDFLGGSYINNCDYDGAFQGLNTLYGDIVKGNVVLAGAFEEFDQSDFFTISQPSASSMDDIGYVYIPSACADGAVTCRLHVALHGCEQGRYAIGDEFARNTGYLELAELNNIIVVFPQAIAQTLGNPYGCWDWWGYTNYLYETKNGNQIVAINRMIEALIQ